MQAYSQDLHECVANACAQPGRTIAQVAAALSVSTAFVNKCLQRQRTTGSVAARPHTGGPSAKLDAAAQAQLVAWVGQRPDSTLAELQAALAAAGGPAVSLTLVWQVLAVHGWRQKKEFPRRRTRHRAGKSVAQDLARGHAGRRFYVLQICGRGRREPAATPGPWAGSASAKACRYTAAPT